MYKAIRLNWMGKKKKWEIKKRGKKLLTEHALHEKYHEDSNLIDRVIELVSSSWWV